MSRGIAVKIGQRQFANKTAALAFFKDILNRYRPGDRVSHDDSIDLAALLTRHTEANKKIGSGVDHFEVMSAEYGTQCFCIVRKDGSSEDFSYVHCLTPKK